MNAEARPLSVLDLVAMKAAGRRIVMLTCYDAVFARLLEQSDVDVLLVGPAGQRVLLMSPAVRWSSWTSRS